MLIRLLAVGDKMPDWVDKGFQEYYKRFSASCPFELVEIPAIKRSKTTDTARIIQQESEKILAKIKSGNRVIALDVKGSMWNTAQLAEQLKNWQQQGRNIDLIIGGPDGLSTECLQKAETKWSLSPLTLPHPLVRVIVAEQLYRAMSILQNHPYHR